MDLRKLEHGLRMIRAGIPYTLPLGQEDNDVPTSWLAMCAGSRAWRFGLEAWGLGCA